MIGEGYNLTWCVLSCSYDFCIEIVILALLTYAACVTLSNYRYISGLDKAPKNVPVLVTVVESVQDSRPLPQTTAEDGVTIELSTMEDDDDSDDEHAEKSEAR